MAEDDNPQDEALEDCLGTVHQLKEENQDLKEENQELRESADTFGNLAERLARTLRKERKTEEDKPGTPADPSFE
jgi:cell division septum initiation protein DivIVA